VIVLYTKKLQEFLEIPGKGVALPDFSFFKKTNRKVLGTMNNIYEHNCLVEDMIDDQKFSHSINQMLFQIDGEHKYPSKAFKEYMLEATLIRSI